MVHFYIFNNGKITRDALNMNVAESEPTENIQTKHFSSSSIRLCAVGHLSKTKQ